MKAALYIRVSTDDQVREGYSIPAQLKALKDYCVREHIDIYDIYIDEGQPGSKENRPKFQLMLKDANKKLFDIILVHKYDRFARKVELSQRIKGNLRKNGINVISISEPIEDSPIGFFQEGMMELLAEYYIKNLSQEVKKGQKEKISQGKAVNMLPYGYKNINGDAVIVEDQANMVRKIFELYNSGLGSQKIANYLNDRGIPTKNNGIWNTSQINYMLRNSAYIGCLKWAGESIKNAIPAIIDSGFFKETQTKISSKLKSNRSEYYNKFLLLGILKCAYCGAPMRISKQYSNGNRNGKVYYMYTCRQARYSKDRCKFSKHIQYKDVEVRVIDNIKDIIKGVRDIDSLVDYAGDIADERIDKTKTKLERAKQAYLAGVFTLEDYKNEKQRLEGELAILEIDKSEEYRKQKARAKIKTVYDKYKSATTIQEKKAILQTILDSVQISKDAILLCFKS